MQPREPGILTSNLPITGRSAPTTWATAAPATNHNKCCSERTRKVMADVFQHRKIKLSWFKQPSRPFKYRFLSLWGALECTMKSLSTWPAFAEDLKTLSIVVSMTNFAQTFPSWVNLILASVHFGSSLKHWYLDFIKRFLIISLTLTLTLNIDLNVKAMFLNQPSSWLKRNSSVQATGWFTVCCSPST